MSQNSYFAAKPSSLPNLLHGDEKLPDTIDDTETSSVSMPRVSVVVPLYNEADSVAELYRRLVEQLTLHGETYELILVDDGSRDDTYSRLADLYLHDSVHVCVVRLRRNFGQTAALAAGIGQARGDIVVTMDGDLQHDPSDLPTFFAKLDEGFDVVSGWRAKRNDNLWTRRIPSRIANWLMARLTNVTLHDFGTTFKAYRRDVLKDLDLHGDLHRFVPALLSWQGVSIAEIPITNPARRSGKSNYGLSRTCRVLCDLITVKFLVSYVSRPLHIFGFIGMVLFAFGFVIGLAITVLYYCNIIEPRNHLGNLMLSMLLMMLGVQLFAIGLTMEVNIRTYHAATGRRTYAVREILSKR